MHGTLRVYRAFLKNSRHLRTEGNIVMRLKRIISIFLIIALTGSLCLLSGCGQDGVKDIQYKVDPSKLLYENNAASYSY